jgi:hypothetical protein
MLVFGYLGSMFFGFKYTHITPVIMLLLFALGLFLLSVFIARGIFRKRKVIEYYFLTSFLTLIFYVIAWFAVGVWQDITGVSCIGYFGAEISCVDQQLSLLFSYPSVAFTLPMLIIFIIVISTAPVIAYALFGKKKASQRKRT